MPGLVEHPGVGFVSALSANGPVAIGRSGRHYLDTGVVEGLDPLQPFGDHAPAMVRHATSAPRAPELYVNSAVDPGSLDVAAFEPLVGCHGGLGGWQDRGFVLGPTHLLAPTSPIVGGDELHRHLVGILEQLGHRSSLQRSSRMNQSRTTRLLMSAAALVIVIAGIKAAADIVGPLMLALSLTLVFHPLRARLERRMPSWAASLVVLVLAYVLILGMTLALVISIGRLATLIPTYAPDLDDIVAAVGDRLAVARGRCRPQADAVAGAAGHRASGGAITALHVRHLGRALEPVLPGHLAALPGLRLREGPSAGRGRAHTPTGAGRRPHHVRQGTRSYLGVSAVFGLIVAVIDTAVLWALGVPGAFVWGVLAFVTNFIPNIGFVIGVIPPAVIGLLEGGPGLMLAVIVLYCVINVIIQSIIQPRYVGQAVGLSTTLTFLSLIFWTWILGPIGALLAVPMSLFFRAVLVDADPESHWKQPLISGDPEPEPTVASP